MSDALSGKADIGMVSRDLFGDEKSRFAIPLARDAVAFVVHRDNPARDISRAQATAIFTGRISNWKALGGRAAPIEVATRTPGRGSMEIVPRYLGIEPELNLVARSVPAGLARAFIEFARSPAARALIAQHDFVAYLN